jgi:cold shock CspA family protein
LAVSLAAIAAKGVVTSVILGSPPDRKAWASVGTQVVDALVKATPKPESTLSRLVRAIEGQSARDFNIRMASGRRFLQDLPMIWRTAVDRGELIRDARAAFVGAVAVAEHMDDPRRIALAEVAIAGCWLWVPSVQDVSLTLARARRVLEQAARAREATPGLLADLAAVRELQEALLPGAPSASLELGRTGQALRQGRAKRQGACATTTSERGATDTPGARRRGAVKRIDRVNHVGIIEPDDKSGDVFLDEASGPGCWGLRRGQRVTFSTQRGPYSLQAREVRLLG